MCFIAAVVGENHFVYFPGARCGPDCICIVVNDVAMSAEPGVDSGDEAALKVS